MSIRFYRPDRAFEFVGWIAMVVTGGIAATLAVGSEQVILLETY